MNLSGLLQAMVEEEVIVFIGLRCAAAIQSWRKPSRPECRSIQQLLPATASAIYPFLYLTPSIMQLQGAGKSKLNLQLPPPLQSHGPPPVHRGREPSS